MIPLGLYDAFQVPNTSSRTTLKYRKHQPALTSTLFRSPSSIKAATIDVVGNDDAAIINNDESVSERVESEEDDQFDWYKAWYPLVPVEILDKDKPHPFQLLGMDVVVWNDAPRNNGEFGSKKKKKKSKNTSIQQEGNWRVFIDECPHRKVPLSEGRIENDGTLFCSYHGWRFEGESGKCVDIPQLMSDEKLNSIADNPRSSCNAFPTKVINGVLFVWPSSDENAVLESELTPVTHNPSEEGAWEGPWNYRELPYGHDYFQENVVDPAHVSISHHNIVGNRYDDQKFDMVPATQLTKEGFKILVKPSDSRRSESTTEFRAPSLVMPATEFDGGKQVLELYSSPSRPGFCNHVGRMVVKKNDMNAPMPEALKQFTLPLPKWMNHLMASAFLNQDALFLHHQERYLHRTKQYTTIQSEKDEMSSYNKVVYPVNSDLGVMNYRKWISKYAGGGIPYKYQQEMPQSSNEVVFDVWNAHTKHCRYCLAALRRLKKFRLASLILATCIGVLRPLGKTKSLIATLIFGGLSYGLHKLIGLFYRYEFSHAKND